jgi:hypothetical protein
VRLCKTGEELASEEMFAREKSWFVCSWFVCANVRCASVRKETEAQSSYIPSKMPTDVPWLPKP